MLGRWAKGLGTAQLGTSNRWSPLNVSPPPPPNAAPLGQVGGGDPGPLALHASMAGHLRHPCRGGAEARGVPNSAKHARVLPFPPPALKQCTTWRSSTAFCALQPLPPSTRPAPPHTHTPSRPGHYPARPLRSRRRRVHTTRPLWPSAATTRAPTSPTLASSWSRWCRRATAAG